MSSRETRSASVSRRPPRRGRPPPIPRCGGRPGPASARPRRPSRTARCGTPCRTPDRPVRRACDRCTSSTAWLRASGRLLVVQLGRVFELVVDVGRDRGLVAAATLVDGAYPALDQCEPCCTVEGLGDE